jgi:cob(I)alamin adenosyltransferase
MQDNGLLITFSGDGKGKTTAALGCVLRTIGWGGKVVFCTFFKKGFSGEFKVLKTLKGCKVYGFCQEHPAFSGNLKKSDFKKLFRGEWEKFKNKFKTIKKCDLLVMDEILIGIRDKILEEKELASFICFAKDQIPGINIILTGRGMSAKIVQKSDIVTEMRCIKHVFPEISAKRGIDY